MSYRDLCTLDDVKRYVPGYVANGTTDDQLEALITSESEAIHDETGREIVGRGDQPAPRGFRIDDDVQRNRRLSVGDLASAGDTDITVELLDVDGTTVVETISRATYRPLYETRLYANADWEPITVLEFPIGRGTTWPLFRSRQTILVTANWGFPTIPPFIVEACAKRVILRYVSDVAQAGTQITAALADLNLAAMFASSRDDVERLKRVRPLSSVRLG